MKWNIFIACLLVTICCNKTTSYSQEVVLKVKKHICYAILKNDTALIEYFIIDKPTRYYVYDTLIFNKEKKMYQSNRSSLTTGHLSRQLTLSDTLCGKMKLLLLPATTDELKRWDALHNQLLYDPYILFVRSRKEALLKQGEEENARAIDKEWNTLFHEIYKSDRETFSMKLQKFIVELQKIE